MEKNPDILSKIARHDGITVPDAYFDSLADRIGRRLPAPADGAPAPRRSLWTAIRPYVYMAAMFAGVWCMLKMFTIMAGNTDLSAMDSNPVLAEAFANDDFMLDYVYDDISQWDLIDEMMEDGSIDDAPFISPDPDSNIQLP